MDPEFLKALQEAFAEEAAEQLSGLMASLIKLEAGGSEETKAETSEELLHTLHSLKGNSRAAGFLKVESLCQAFESALLSLKRRHLLLQPDAADVMHKCVDLLDALIGSAEENAPNYEQILEALEIFDQRRIREASESEGDTLNEVPEKEKTNLQPPLPQSNKNSEPEQSARSEKAVSAPERGSSVRMPIWKLDRLLREAEEMLVVKQVVEQNIEDCTEMRSIAKMLNAESRRFSDLIRQKKLSDSSEVHDFVNWLQQFATTVETRVKNNLRRQQQQQRECGNLVDNFLDSVKSLLMQDFSGILSIMPKIVRDLSRELSKSIELEVFGTDIEIDRRILEEIKDPLIHLVRNSLDHGIETPEERQSIGKKPVATLKIGAIQTGDGRVQVIISDDGRGINVNKVKQAAVREGVLSPTQAEQITRSEALELIYRSAVSTSEKLTEISGRGLGMAIVRDRIQELGGRIELDTEEGAGTTFRLVLPVKLSTFRGIHVIAGGLSFIVPTLNIHHAGRVRLSEISSSGSRCVAEVNKQLVSVQFLTDVLEIESPADRHRNNHQLLVIGTNSERTGFLVDEIFQEHEVLVRPFAAPLIRVPNFSGATVLGSGKVLPVINVADLLRTAAKAKHADEALLADLRERRRLEQQVRPLVFIVDYPTTSRVMVKTLMEQEGYRTQIFDEVEHAINHHLEEKPVAILKSTDPKLDVMNELDVIYPIEQAFPETPILLFGGTNEKRSHDFALSVGAFGYINTFDFDRVSASKLIKQVILKEQVSV